VHRGQLPRQAHLRPIDANGPLDRLHVDLCGPFPRSQGCVYIMVCVDAFTRYLIATPLRDKTAESVAEALVNQVFCKIGLCRQLCTDLGREFQNKMISHICRLLHVTQLQLRTTAYWPRCNGRVERTNRVLNSLMAKHVAENQRDWVEQLQPCVFAYNVSRNEATSFSPYYLMFAREAICPLDLLIDTPKDDPPEDEHAYAAAAVERLRKAFKVVTQHTGQQVARMKRHYDANVNVQIFTPGQFVWYYYPRKRPGRSPKWSRFYTGPYEMVANINAVNYLIRRAPKSKAIVCHIDKLKRYYGPTPEAWKSVGHATVTGEGPVPSVRTDQSVPASTGVRTLPAPLITAIPSTAETSSVPY
jgi:hypothetical protein